MFNILVSLQMTLIMYLIFPNVTTTMSLQMTLVLCLISWCHTNDTSFVFNFLFHQNVQRPLVSGLSISLQRTLVLCLISCFIRISSTKHPSNKILLSQSNHIHQSLISTNSFAPFLTSTPLLVISQSVSGNRLPGSAVSQSLFVNWNGNVEGHRDASSNQNLQYTNRYKKA